MADPVEEDRVAGRAIVLVGVTILLLLVASLLFLGWLASHYRLDRPPDIERFPSPPPPRIDPQPRAELEGYLAAQRARLEGYGWADDRNEWVHIPIERAMALYARQAAKGGSP
jgi:hypothetical protein